MSPFEVSVAVWVDLRLSERRRGIVRDVEPDSHADTFETGPADAGAVQKRGRARHPWPSLSRPSYARALAAITAAGALLRLAFLARQSIGYDEDFTALVLHQTPGHMMDILSHDSAAPLFYLLAGLVTGIANAAGLASFGGPGGPVALRLVPAAAGIALIPLIAALGRRIGGNSSGLWAAAFTAFAPATVWLSGFARMYGLAAALTVAASLLMWRAVERPTIGRWAAYSLVAAAAVWTHYLSILALAGILLAGLSLRPPRRVAASAFVATAAAVISIVPWLVAASAQLEHAGQGFWVEPLSPSLIGGTIAQLVAGPPTGMDPPVALPLALLQAVAIAAALTAATAVAVSWRRHSQEWRRASEFCLCAAAGAALLAVVSVWRPLLDARYASLMWLPLFALAGAGLAALPRKLALAAVVALLVPSVVISGLPTRAETSFLVPDVNAGVGPHDLVAVDQNHYMILADQGTALVRARLHVLTTGTPGWFVGTSAYAPGTVIGVVPDDVPANGGRVFWVADPGAPPPSLPAGYSATTSRCVIGACLTVYVHAR